MLELKMDKRKKKQLESKGYKVGTVEQFLDLSKEESEYIELKLALSEALAKRRKSSKLTQVQLAKILKSSQSRVAKMEKGDPSVSLDLLVKSLLAMGAKKENIAKFIAWLTCYNFNFKSTPTNRVSHFKIYYINITTR